MTRANQNIPSERGDIFIAGDSAVITDTVQASDGTAKDLTGATVRFALTERRGEPPVVEKDSSGGVTITDAAGGVVEVRLGPDDTAGLGSGQGRAYRYEIEAEDASGQVATVTTGTFTIHSDIA